MIVNLAAGFFWPPFWAVLFASAPSYRTCHTWRHHFWAMAIAGACGGLVGLVFGYSQWLLPGYLFWIAAGIWYFTRRKRKRAAELLGAKSRALRDALVRKARELSQPRPVLRPVPGGAG